MCMPYDEHYIFENTNIHFTFLRFEIFIPGVNPTGSFSNRSGSCPTLELSTYTSPGLVQHQNDI